MSEIYDVVIGGKRQLTIPARLFREMALKEGDHLRLTLEEDAVRLEPMVAVPRSMVSPSLLREMDARRGPKANDLTLEEFRARRQQQENASGAERALAVPRLSEWADLGTENRAESETELADEGGWSTTA